MPRWVEATRVPGLLKVLSIRCPCNECSRDSPSGLPPVCPVAPTLYGSESQAAINVIKAEGRSPLLQITKDKNDHFVGTCTACAWQVTSHDREYVNWYYGSHSCGKERYPRPGEALKDVDLPQQSESTDPSIAATEGSAPASNPTHAANTSEE
jgi:hypothetical protein